MVFSKTIKLRGILPLIGCLEGFAMLRHGAVDQAQSLMNSRTPLDRWQRNASERL